MFDNAVLNYFIPDKGEYVDEATGKTIYSQGDKIVRVFDRRTLNLLRSEMYSVTGRVLQKEKLFAKTTFDWEEHDGVFVLTDYHDVRNARVTVGGRTETGKKITKVKFHWFVVNDDLDASLVDGSMVKDRAAIIDLTIPEKVGATSLIEKGAERSELENH